MSLIGFLRRLFRREAPPHFSGVLRVPELPDVPDPLSVDTIYITGSHELPKWAVLRCPCDRGHRVTLALQGYPAWSVKSGRGGPSVYPSIDVRGDLAGGTRCHYWIRDGRVHWVPPWSVS